MSVDGISSRGNSVINHHLSDINGPGPDGDERGK